MGNQRPPGGVVDNRYSIAELAQTRLPYNEGEPGTGQQRKLNPRPEAWVIIRLPQTRTKSDRRLQCGQIRQTGLRRQNAITALKLTSANSTIVPGSGTGAIEDGAAPTNGPPPMVNVSAVIDVALSVAPVATATSAFGV
jgi:hypothetical protein